MPNRPIYKKSRKLLPLTIVGVLLIVASVGAYFIFHKPAKTVLSTETGNSLTQVKKSQDQGQFNPKTSSEEVLRTQAQSPAASAQAPNQSTAVKPIITGTDQNQTDFTVDALVSNQSSGTCTATLSRNGYPNLSASSQVTQITSYYACKTMRFSLATISRGDWDLVVSFSSNSGSGSSDKQVVSIK